MARATQAYRIVRAAGLALSVLVVMTGCGSVSSPGDDSIQAGPGSAGDEAGKGPWNLVGSWLLDAEGEEAGAVLRLDDGDLSLWRKCDVLEGSWRADRAGLFVASVYADSHPCSDPPIELPGWLAASVRYRFGDHGPELVNAAGQVVARLRPGGRPTAPPNVAPSMADPPTVDEDTSRVFPVPPRLPSDLTAADAGSLVGSWAPTEDPYASERRQPVRLEINADGGYVGFDGCNGIGGRWVSGSEGAVLATNGISTLIGCHNIDVGSWFAGASRAGFDGDVLVLFDQHGQETGRLRPA